MRSASSRPGAGVENYARERRFSAGSVERWQRQPEPARGLLLDLAGRLRLGENQFRGILDNLEDIAAWRGCDISEVLGDSAVTATLARPLGRNDAIKALKQTLRRLRYPRLCEMQAHLTGLVRDLHLPEGVEIHLPENLDGAELRVVVRGARASAVREVLQATQGALAGKALDEIFRVLEGEW